MYKAIVLHILPLSHGISIESTENSCQHSPHKLKEKEKEKGKRKKETMLTYHNKPHYTII